MQLCSEPLTTASYYCRLKPLVCLICNQVGQYIVPSGDQDGTAVACLGWRVPTLRLGRAMENKFDVSEVLDEEGAIPLKTRMEAGEAWQLVDTTVVSPVDTVFHVGGFCTSGNCCNKVEKHICGRKTRTRRWVLALIAAAVAGVLLLLLLLDHRTSAAFFESRLIPSRQPMNGIVSTCPGPRGHNDSNIHLTYSFGDSWNATLSVSDCDGTVLASGLTISEYTDFAAVEVCIPASDGYIITAGGGAYDNEISWSLLDVDGTVQLEGAAGTVSTCPEPMTIAELYYPDVDFSGPYDPLLLGAPDRDVSLGAFGGVPARRYDFQLVKLKYSALDPGVLQLSASPVWYCWLASDTCCLICSHDFR